MKNRVLKILSVMLSAVIILSGLSVAASATLFAGEINRPAVWVGGIKVTDENYNDVFGDGGSVKYDYEWDKLILTNATITGTYNIPEDTFAYDSEMTDNYCGIFVNQYLNDHQITIELVGENHIDLTGFDAELAKKSNIFGIYLIGAEIRGEGSLRIDTCDAAVTAGIYHNSTLHLFQDCEVEIYTGDATLANYGIWGDSTPSFYTAILDVNNGSSLKIRTGDLNYSGNSAEAALYGICNSHTNAACSYFSGSNIERKGGKISVETGTLNNFSNAKTLTNCAIKTGWIDVTDEGEINAAAGEIKVSGNAQTARSIGIDVNYHGDDTVANVFAKNSKIIAKGYTAALANPVILTGESTAHDIFVSENYDGSKLVAFDGEKNAISDYLYVMVCPEGTFIPEEPELNFFEKIMKAISEFFASIGEFFANLFG